MPVHPSVHPSVFLFIWLLWYVADNFSNVSSCLIAVVMLLVAGFTLELIFVMSSMLLLQLFSEFLICNILFCCSYGWYFLFPQKSEKSCYLPPKEFKYFWLLSFFLNWNSAKTFLNNYLFVCSFHLFFLLHILKFLCFLAKLLFSFFLVASFTSFSCINNNNMLLLFFFFGGWHIEWVVFAVVHSLVYLFMQHMSWLCCIELVRLAWYVGVI